MRKYKRTRNKREKYFTDDTQDAIVEYLSCDNTFKKDKIFAERIYYPFNKIAENLIHTYKFYYLTNDTSFEDVKHDVVVFLVEKMSKYNPSKGKAFSYFNQVALNYLILNNKLKYRELQMQCNLDIVDDERNLVNESVRKENQEELADFFKFFVDYMKNSLSLYFDTEREIIIADCLFEIINLRDEIENFNKKAIYINVREMANVKTEHITPVLNKIQDIYTDLYKFYRKNGNLNVSGSFW